MQVDSWWLAFAELAASVKEQYKETRPFWALYIYIMLYADPKQPCTFDVRLIDRTTVNIARKKHGDHLKSAEVRPGKESAHCVPTRFRKTMWAVAFSVCLV